MDKIITKEKNQASCTLQMFQNKTIYLKYKMFLTEALSFSDLMNAVSLAVLFGVSSASFALISTLSELFKPLLKHAGMVFYFLTYQEHYAQNYFILDCIIIGFKVHSYHHY